MVFNYFLLCLLYGLFHYFINFITYRTVQASGIARRDPPRHEDVIIQIRQHPAHVALFREKSMICSKILHFRRSTEELRPRERSHEFRAGRLV